MGKHWRSQYESAMREPHIKLNRKERAAAGDGTTVTDNRHCRTAIADGFDPEIFQDFSEEDLANGIRKVIDMRARCSC